MATIGPIKYVGLSNRLSHLQSSPLTTSPVGIDLSLPIGQMSICKNLRLMFGSLMPTSLYTPKCSALNGSNSPNGFSWWVDNANYSQGIRAYTLCGGKLYSGPLSLTSSITFTDRTGATTIASYPSLYTFDSLNNILVGAGGSSTTGVPFQVTAYNGNASALAGAPLGDIVKTVNNFMFIGRQLGSSTTFSRVNWSNVGDPTTWTSGNYLDFRVNDGDRIITLGAIGSDLYIFKRNSIGRLSVNSVAISGASTLGPLVTVFSGIGAMAPLAIGNLPDGKLVFVASDGKLKLFDGYSMVDLSDVPYPLQNVQPSIDQMVNGGNSGLMNLVVNPSDNLIVISCPSMFSASTYLTLTYDYVNKFWSERTGLNPAVLLTVPSLENTTLSASYIGQSYSLWEAAYNGTIVYLTDSSVWYGATDESGSTISSSFTMSVILSGDLSTFTPRSLIIPVVNFNTGMSISATTKFDGTSSSSSKTFSGSGSATVPPSQKNLIVCLDSFYGTNLTRPRSIQISISSAGGPIYLPMYLSDEVMS